MKKSIFFRPVEIIPVLIFLIGAGFVIYSLPFANIIILSASPISFFILLAQHLIHKEKAFILTKLAISLNLCIWLLYFSFRILFIENAEIIFYISLIASISTFVLSVFKKQIVVIQKFFLLVHITLGIFFYFYPNHKLYYTIHLGSEAMENPEGYSYKSWDNYSWYLYQDKEYDQALDANYFAYKAALAEAQAIDNKKIIQTIESHKLKIEQRNWNVRF